MVGSPASGRHHALLPPPTRLPQTIECDGETYILDAAEEAGELAGLG